MTTTLVSSAKREVRIGFDQPFCIIGERINPTGRKRLAEEMRRRETIAESKWMLWRRLKPVPTCWILTQVFRLPMSLGYWLSAFNWCRALTDVPLVD